MARPTTRQSLIDYCKRQLGDGVTEINVTDEQCDDSCDDALQYYQEFHSDATVRVYRKHLLTSQDITNEYITIPDTILNVSRVLPISVLSRSSANLFSLNYQVALNASQDLYRSLDLVTYEMTRQHMNLINSTFNSLDEISQFSRHQGKLYLRLDWGKKIVEGDYIVIEAYELIDPDASPKVYNDLYLKRYLTAKIKKHYGMNLKKFEGVQLPGGVTVNGQPIFDEAVAEIEKLEEEMQAKWATPPGFFVG